MKKTILVFLTLVLVSVSCERNDLSAYVGNSVTEEVTDLTSDSFTLVGVFTLNAGVATSSQVGFYLDDEPGITTGKYDIITEMADITNGGKRYRLNFSNIDENNERIYEVGTTVYCRAFLRVTDTDYNTHSYVLGDEISFVIPEADYTLMVYGLGGGNLDYWNAQSLLVPMMLSGRNGNIDVTFQYKPSKSFQEGGENSSDMDMQGVHRWVVPFEGVFSKVWKVNSIPTDPVEYVKFACNNFVRYSEKVGDANMNMADPQNLASFINWSMQKCPAKHYILLMKNHGGGWDLYDDGNTSVSSKAQLFDDNTNGKMSLIDFIEGIETSSLDELDAVIFDECMMSTMENLAELSTVCHNAMAAQEITYSLDGENLMSIFKSGIAANQDVFTMLSDLSDDYVQKNPDDYTDHGAYDLDKMDDLLSVVNNVTAFLIDNYNNSANWKYSIGSGITKALWSAYFLNEDDRAEVLNVKEKVKNWQSLSEAEKDGVVNSIVEINSRSHYGYCMYDFIAQTIHEAEEYQEEVTDPDFAQQIQQLKNLLSDYNSALRSMSHIACSNPLTADTPYEYTSISVCLQSLHSNYYTPISKENLYGYTHASELPLADALVRYSALEFDKRTSWSDFLQIIMTSGTPFFNDDRRYRQTGN